jgi:hypothetical protein
MSALVTCDVASVEQAAVVLGECAELTSEGNAACARAGSATWRWRGPASRSFDAALGGLGRQLSEVESAHREAADAVRAYVRALADAVELARRADAMDREAEVLSASFRRAAAGAAAPLCGPDPGEATRAAATRLRHEARDQEEIAASWAAAKLEGLAERAPRAPRFTGSSRFFDDFVGAVGQSFVGLAQLGVLTGESLGNGHREREARHELWGTAKDSLKVWQPVQDMWRDLTGGRPGSAFGAAAGMAVTRKPGLAKVPSSFSELHALREAAVRAQLLDHAIRRQSAIAMGRNGIALKNEEARGGHVLVKHVGVDDEYLFARNHEGLLKAGTFNDLPSAERLINEVLRRNKGLLPGAYALKATERLRFIETFDEPTGRVAVAGSSRTVVAHKVRVVVGLEGGEPFVYTAFPEL